MKKSIQITSLQPVEEAPEVEMERFQAIRSVESSLEIKAREADVDVNTAASILASIERECLLEERPESELDAARVTHWKARKAQAQAHDALAVHKATYPNLNADINRLRAEIDRKKYQARQREYERKTAVGMAYMDLAKAALEEAAVSHEQGFPLLSMDKVFGNGYHAGEYGLFKKTVALTCPHLLDPADPVSKEAKRVAEYLLDHERSSTTGMSPHQARQLGSTPKTTAIVESKNPGWLDGLRSAVGLA